jgi:Tfp pilus assembly protein PilN
MINLLSPNMKKQMRAARMNVTLYHYCMLLLSTALLLGAVFAVGFWTNYNSLQLALGDKANNATAAQAYAKTRAAAEDFAKNLASAKTILAGNVSFTELVLDIAGVVPPGVVLNTLTLGANTAANAPIDISGRATSYGGAIALKNSLDSSPIFENVSIVNVSQADVSTPGQTSPLVQKYPFSLSLKAQFTKNATGVAK